MREGRDSTREPARRPHYRCERPAGGAANGTPRHPSRGSARPTPRLERRAGVVSGEATTRAEPERARKRAAAAKARPKVHGFFVRTACARSSLRQRVTTRRGAALLGGAAPSSQRRARTRGPWPLRRGAGRLLRLPPAGRIRTHDLQSGLHRRGVLGRTQRVVAFPPDRDMQNPRAIGCEDEVAGKACLRTYVAWSKTSLIGRTRWASFFTTSRAPRPWSKSWLDSVSGAGGPYGRASAGHTSPCSTRRTLAAWKLSASR